MDSTSGMGDGTVPLVAYPNHNEYDLEPLRIVQLRRETIDCAMVDGLRFLGEFEGSDPRNFCAVSGVVIERAMKGTNDLLVHTYSLSPRVIEHLELTGINVLVEDAALLRFCLASPHEAGMNRTTHHREISALQVENRKLLQRIHRLEQAALATRNPMEGAAAKGSSEDMMVAVPQREIHTAPVIATRPATSNERPLHSPLSWDMETEAKRNARTPYDPYKQRSAGGVNSRLDTVTQAQMVARLHDQSVDLRERRRRENEQLVLRELGLQERRILNPSDQYDMAQRLHDQTIARAKSNMKKLEELYLPPPPRRSLSPQQQKESANRMHDEAVAHAKKNHEKLFQEYVQSHDLEKKRLSSDQQRAMADRLSKKTAAA